MKNSVDCARKELESFLATGFKEDLVEFRNTQNLNYKLAMASEKTACSNQTQLLLQFKDQAMLTQQLASQASKELSEDFCRLKEIVRLESTQTRSLMESLERDRLRERAAKAENLLNTYFARGVTPVMPST